MRRRKRGRRARRLRVRTVSRVVVDGRVLHARAAQQTAQAASAQFRRALRQFVARPRRITVPDDDLVLVADGVWFQFDGLPWVLYLVGIKPVHNDRAVFLDPVLLPRRESVEQWAHVFATLPAPVRSRVRAVVSDNLRGMTHLVAAQGWVAQLCHFHLISQLHGQRARRKSRLPERARREQFYQLTRRALDLPDGSTLATVVRHLREWVRQPAAAWRLRMVVREFLRRIDAFRAYQRHPELRLPTTTGAVEAMAHIVRAALYRARSVRTPSALQLWATAIIRLRPSVKCNGRHQPN